MGDRKRVLLPIGGIDPAAESLVAAVAELVFCFDAEVREEAHPRRTLSPVRLQELRGEQDRRVGELLPGVHAVYALGVAGTLELTAAAIESAPLLELIGDPGVASDQIDAAAAAARGVAVVDAAAATAVPRAEHALALMLALARRIAASDLPPTAEPPPECLDGRALGLVGFDDAARALAQRCRRGFGMRVLVHDPLAAADDLAAHGATAAGSLEELLAHSDYLSIHTEEESLIGIRELALLRPGARVIDVTGGDALERAALVSALAEGTLAGAGVDLPAEDAADADDPLLALANVVVTFGMAAAASDLPARAARACLAGMALALAPAASESEPLLEPDAAG